MEHNSSPAAASKKLIYLLSLPFIYGMFLPLAIFHLALEIYHQICFRLYGIPRVSSRDYFIYDRELLPRLDWLEKFNCVYCSYANNLMRYAAEIGGRTERYWCPLKYHRRLSGAHSQYAGFLGGEKAGGFRDRWRELRDFSDLEKPAGKNK